MSQQYLIYDSNGAKLMVLDAVAVGDHIKLICVEPASTNAEGKLEFMGGEIKVITITKSKLTYHGFVAVPVNLPMLQMGPPPEGPIVTLPSKKLLHPVR